MVSFLLRDVKMNESELRWGILGHLTYHIYEVKFEVREDELQYRVTCCERNLRTINEPIDSIEDVQIHEFNNVGDARDAFQNAVNYCMSATSRSDVSLVQSRIAFS